MNDLSVVLAPVILALGATAVLLIDLVIPREQKHVTGWLSAAVIGVALAAAATQWGRSASSFEGMVKTDSYAIFLDGLFAVIGIVVTILSLRYNAASGIMRGEFYPLLLFSLSGMSLLGHARDLLTVFLGIELLSIPLYVLCGFARPKADSEESAMKYFLLGAFASGFLVYGIAMVYGATGSTNLEQISRSATSSATLLAGAGLLLVGLGFKVAAAPFHMWTPDVYEGAPTIVTAFMTTATKAAGFAALAVVFLFGFAPIAATVQPALIALAALTMVVGNVAALAQTQLKRLLAYSSIAHAGYALVGLAAGGGAGVTGVLFYMAAYAITSLAAFAVMTAVGSDAAREDQSVEAYRGLFSRRPMLALIMAVALFSLIGIPPTAGFAGKYFLFQAAVGSGFAWLAVLGVLTSALSAAYYLRVIVTMFTRAEAAAPEAGSLAAPRTVLHGAVTAAVAVVVLAIGILPAALLALASQGAAGVAP